VYVCVCVHIHTYIHTYTHTHTMAGIPAGSKTEHCVCVCVCVYTYIHTYTHTHTQWQASLLEARPSTVCVCVCVYIHIYIHIHTHTHTMAGIPAGSKTEHLPLHQHASSRKRPLSRRVSDGWTWCGSNSWSVHGLRPGQDLLVSPKTEKKKARKRDL
jgi:hypothetical protein